MKIFKWKFLNPWHWLRRLLPRTLFMRSLLIIVLPILLLQIVVMSVFVDNHWRKITSRLAFSVAGEVAIFADELEQEKRVAVDRNKLDTIANYAAQNLDLLVSFEEGATLVAAVNTDGAWEQFTVAALSKSIKEQVRRPFSLSVSDEDNWVNIGIQLDNGVLRVLALDRRLFSSSAYIFLFWVWGSSLILLSIAILFMRNQIRPIKRLARAASHMGLGREILPFKPEGAREVRQAGKAFLEMHDRISRQIEQRTIMLAGISHDLRTPLTRLKLGLSLLGDNEEIAALKQDIVDMERMISSYLDFVRLENTAEKSEDFDFATLMNKLIDQLRRQGVMIVEQIAEGSQFHGRPIALERAITNILNNARKYGKKIDVSLIATKNRLDDQGENDPIIITIEDDGVGVPPERYEDVFKPFFRLDTARNIASNKPDSANSAAGVGLGLCIARDIIQQHSGTIKLGRSKENGLKVIVTLPNSRSETLP